jgi:ABC-type antimicrobial peptide transport system permease subunit
MIEKFQFYLKHSLNDLQVNGQRTFFALLCIAAGVAAIVSLQTLAVMIDSTLTGNLQQQNLGDIQAEINPFTDGDAPFGNDEINILPPEERERRQEIIDADREAGYIASEEQGFFGASFETDTLTEAGLKAIRTELAEQFPPINGEPQVEVTYQMVLQGGGAFILGFGDGVNLRAPELDTNESYHVALVVDADVYPFYDEVELTDERTLSEAFAAYEQTDPDVFPIILSENSRDGLSSDTVELGAGDIVNIDGSSATYEVIGSVPTQTEIRNLESGFLFGFYGNYYYIPPEALSSFEQQLSPSMLYFRLQDETLLSDVQGFLAQRFPYLELQTTEDLREQNEVISENLNTLVTVMGLLSLLLGSIGIINTMQVVVRRRVLEIAVLKTIGVQGRQVTILFLTQAFIMGVLGSIGGVLLGWFTVFLIRSVPESVLQQSLAFEFALQPVINGVIVGTLVTTVFGFIPTLSAGQVRPGIVLRPSETVIPRAGRFISLIALFGMMVALAVIAQGILGSDFGTALFAVVGAFFAAGVIFVMLWLLIWIIGRFVPSFGIVDLKLSKRQILATRSRGALTLLALVVAVFSLSTITLFADSVTNLFDSLLQEDQAEPVIIQPALPGAISRIEPILAENEDITRYTINYNFDAPFVRIEKADGTTIETVNGVLDYIGMNTVPFNPLNFDLVNAYTESALGDSVILDGVNLLEAPDTGDKLPLIFPDGEIVQGGAVEVGDTIVFRISGEIVDFEVVGIQEQQVFNVDTSFTAGIYTSFAAVDAAGLSTDQVNITATMPEDAVNDLRDDLREIPGVFVFDIRAIVGLIETLLGQFQAFPSLIATLGLIVGGVVIANSVALSTLERRQQIAVMKSVGLQRERVLGMLLLENSLLGFIGGLLGVGTGVIALVAVSSSIDLPLDVIPWGVAFLLMMLCVGVAVLAALTTAWGASGEKPLNVLRYE